MCMWMGSLSLLSACILDRTGQGAPGTHLFSSAGIVRCHQMWILCVLAIEFRSSGLHSKLLMSLSLPPSFLGFLFLEPLYFGEFLIIFLPGFCVFCASVSWFNSEFTGNYVAVVQEGVSVRAVSLRLRCVIKYSSIFSWQLLCLACIGFQAGDKLEGIFCSPSKSVLTLLYLRPSEVPGTYRPKVLGTSAVSSFWVSPKQ